MPPPELVSPRSTRARTAAPLPPLLLLLGCLLALSSLLVERRAAAGDDGRERAALRASSPQPRQQQQPRPDPRRRLMVIDEETQMQQMKSYLGGLYPPVDRDMLPLYLRDTADDPDGQYADFTRQRDLVFFWHIPKASGSTMKNILNFCFDLKRAEKLHPEPVSFEVVDRRTSRCVVVSVVSRRLAIRS